MKTAGSAAPNALAEGITKAVKCQLNHNTARCPTRETGVLQLHRESRFPCALFLPFSRERYFFLRPLMFCTLLRGFKRVISASRTLMECKYQYKLVSPIKIKPCVRPPQFFYLAQGCALDQPMEHMPSPALLVLMRVSFILFSSADRAFAPSAHPAPLSTT